MKWWPLSVSPTKSLNGLFMQAMVFDIYIEPINEKHEKPSMKNIYNVVLQWDKYCTNKKFSTVTWSYPSVNCRQTTPYYCLVAIHYNNYPSCIACPCLMCSVVVVSVDSHSDEVVVIFCVTRNVFFLLLWSGDQ